MLQMADYMIYINTAKCKQNVRINYPPKGPLGNHYMYLYVCMCVYVWVHPYIYDVWGDEWLGPNYVLVWN